MRLSLHVAENRGGRYWPGVVFTYDGDIERSGRPSLVLHGPRPHQTPLRRPPTVTARTPPLASSLPSPQSESPLYGLEQLPEASPPSRREAAHSNGDSSGNSRSGQVGAGRRQAKYGPPAGGRARNPATALLTVYHTGAGNHQRTRQRWAGWSKRTTPRPGAQDPAQRSSEPGAAACRRCRPSTLSVRATSSCPSSVSLQQEVGDRSGLGEIDDPVHLGDAHRRGRAGQGASSSSVSAAGAAHL